LAEGLARDEKAAIPKKGKFFQKIFGCKLNRYDAELLRTSLLEAGYEEVEKEKEADFLIIHSCVVTHKAERDVRKASHHLRKSAKKGAVVLLSGCLTPSLKELEGVDFAGSLNEVATFLQVDLPDKTGYQKRARALVKIQEGCGFSCSYCIVPQVRGRPRSRPMEEVLEEIEHLLEVGHREIVLTGTEIGEWGREWGKTLFDLLKEVERLPYEFRVRISSILPNYLTLDLVSIWKGNPARFASHFHVPLQSGSPKVLREMRRPYTLDAFRKSIDLLIRALPDVSLGTDLIAGFPTETDEDFEKTIRVIEEVPFAYLHVFEYSRRPGTQAESLPLLPHKVVKERVRTLLILGVKKRREYAERFIHRELDVIVEKCEKFRCFGTSSNYLRVFFDVKKETNLKIGKTVNVFVKEIISTPTFGPAIVGGELREK